MEKKIRKEKVDTVRELWKNPKGKAVLFFLFYLVFFIILISSIRGGTGKMTSKIEKKNSTLTANYNLEKIKAGNYRFTRIEVVNGLITTFSGENNHDRSEVTMAKNDQIKSYFMYGDIVLEKESNFYRVGVNPYLYSRLGEYRYIKEILEKAMLKSRTTYQQGETVYLYEITTTSLISLLDGKEVDLDDVINTVEVVISDEKDIEEIRYHINGYYQFTMLEQASADITIHYKDYGKVEHLEIPE